MDALAREYYDTHEPEMPEEIFELARRRWNIDVGGRGFGVARSPHDFRAIPHPRTPPAA